MTSICQKLPVHYLDMVGVTGSIPVVPTILFKPRRRKASFREISTKAVLGRDTVKVRISGPAFRSQLPYFVARIQVSLRVLVHGITWRSRTIQEFFKRVFPAH